MTDLGTFLADPERLAKAIVDATLAHVNQKDKLGAPYILHPLDVMIRVQRRGGTTNQLIAAVLHDPVEDTNLTLDYIEQTFGEEVAALVDAVTKRPGESYPDFISRIIATTDDLWASAEGRWSSWMTHPQRSGPALIKLCDIDGNTEPDRLLAIPDQPTRDRLMGKYVPAKGRLLAYLNLER